MSKLEEEREELKFDIEWEKRAKKILLICTAICCGIGLIIGVAQGIVMQESILDVLLGVLLFGIWFGPGLGGAISLFPSLYYVHKEAKKRGEENSSAVFILILFLFFLFVGPIGLLVRVLRMNYRIKKFKNQLSEVKS